MNIELFGVRGSLPAPLSNREYKEKIFRILDRFSASGSSDLNTFWKDLPPSLKYLSGGNTTCVYIESSAGNKYMIDMGTGARLLGDRLLGKEFGRGAGAIEIFITHTHWDHIQGLPFFKPLYIPGNELKFHSPYGNLEERFVKQQEQEFFPVPFHLMGSTRAFYHLKPNDVITFDDGMEVSLCLLRHPGGSCAYKFTENGKSFIFATDVEFTGDDLDYIRSLDSFFGGADLLIIDSQYTLDESFSKFDWGHTAYTMAVNSANIWKVKNLMLTHHEPAYSDTKLAEIHREAVEHYRNLDVKNEMKIYLAREGLRIKL